METELLPISAWMAVAKVDDQSGLTILEILIVLFVLALVAGLPLFARLPTGGTSVREIESFVALAVTQTMTNGKDSILYAGAYDIRHADREITWEPALGRLGLDGDGEHPIVLYTNGTSSEWLALEATEGAVGLLTVPRW